MFIKSIRLFYLQNINAKDQVDKRQKHKSLLEKKNVMIKKLLRVEQICDATISLCCWILQT